MGNTIDGQATKESEIQRMVDGMELKISQAENRVQELRAKLGQVLDNTPSTESECASKTPVQSCMSPLGQGMYVFNDRLDGINGQLQDLLNNCVL